MNVFLFSNFLSAKMFYQYDLQRLFIYFVVDLLEKMQVPRGDYLYLIFVYPIYKLLSQQRGHRLGCWSLRLVGRQPFELK